MQCFVHVDDPAVGPDTFEVAVNLKRDALLYRSQHVSNSLPLEAIIYIVVIIEISSLLSLDGPVIGASSSRQAVSCNALYM